MPRYFFNVHNLPPALLKRRRYKQSMPLKDRLAAFAAEMREKAARLRPGIEQDNFLRRARQADTAQHLDDWANSAGLQPPT
jgi:hypothetical protein